MTRTFCKLIAVLSLLPCAAAANAGSIQVTFSKELVEFIGVPETLPFGGLVDLYSFSATTDGDILSVNNVQLILEQGVSPYQVPPPFGSNVEPPPPAFIAIVPNLRVDSWITTPGATTLLGADLPGDGASTWGDLSNDGPQTNFKFAQLGLPRGASLAGSFRISIADPTNTETGIYTESFQILPAEPTASAIAAIGLIVLAAPRRLFARSKRRLAPGGRMSGLVQRS